jgi:hypothetical protein
VTGATWPTGLLIRALLVAPIAVLAVAILPGVLLYPVLPAGPGQRVIALIEQLRGWHSDAVQRLIEP